jgi:hypothetical protein
VIAAVGVFIAHQRKEPGFVAARSPYAVDQSAPSKCTKPDTKKKYYVGAVVYRPWQTTLPDFEQASGVNPVIQEYYVGFGSPFNIYQRVDVSKGVIPIIQIDPWTAKLSAIAGGKYDTYLTAQAKVVKDFGCPIAISFGHEMNGNWYPWGSQVGTLHPHKGVTPAAFVAAWRHIVNVFRKADVHNVRWTWTINRVSPFVTTNIKDWWPGGKYVSWVGLDAYYRHPGQTFGDVFNHTIQTVRALTKDPILITETGVTPQGPQGANIEGLFAGAKKAHLFGVVWFNVKAKAEWQLQGRPASVLADFTKAALAFTGQTKTKTKAHPHS